MISFFDTNIYCYQKNSSSVLKKIKFMRGSELCFTPDASVSKNSRSQIIYNRIDVLKCFAQNAIEKHLFSFLIIKKENLAQVFSCEFCKIFKNSYFTKDLRLIASGFWRSNYPKQYKKCYTKNCLFGHNNYI